MGAFILSLLVKGEGDTTDIAMRRMILEELDRTFITRAKYEKNITRILENISLSRISTHFF